MSIGGGPLLLTVDVRNTRFGWKEKKNRREVPIFLYSSHRRGGNYDDVIYIV